MPKIPAASPELVAALRQLLERLPRLGHEPQLGSTIWRKLGINPDALDPALPASEVPTLASDAGTVMQRVLDRYMGNLRRIGGRSVQSDPFTTPKSPARDRLLGEGELPATQKPQEFVISKPDLEDVAIRRLGDEAQRHPGTPLRNLEGNLRNALSDYIRVAKDNVPVPEREGKVRRAAEQVGNIGRGRLASEEAVESAKQLVEKRGLVPFKERITSIQEGTEPGVSAAEAGIRPPATPAEVLDLNLLDRDLERKVRALPEILSQLTPRQRAVIDMSWGLSGPAVNQADVARQLKITDRTVRNDLTTGLKALREALGVPPPLQEPTRGLLGTADVPGAVVDPKYKSSLGLGINRPQVGGYVNKLPAPPPKPFFSRKVFLRYDPMFPQDKSKAVLTEMIVTKDKQGKNVISYRPISQTDAEKRAAEELQ